VAKGAATDWKVVVNSVVLSNWAFDVAVEDTKERLEVSGFNPTGSREYVPGLSEQVVTVQMRNDMASGGPFATIRPLYEGGSAFPFFVQRDSDAGTSATNPIYGGTASVFSFPIAATLNEVEEVTYEFAPAAGATFRWGTAFPPAGF
jgi:hypothetical protein